MNEGVTETARRMSFRSDQIDPADLQRLLFVLDLQAGLPGVQRLRRWADEALAVAAGERAVDVGSGTGEPTQVLAAAAGTEGEAVGVDPNPGMLAEAERRAAAAESAARFVDGSATALPFADGSVDALRCERVFQHLPEPELAAAEVARVLRPGGRAVVLDSDWGTAILHPGDPDVIRSATETMLGNTANPHSGRRLPGLLTAAGLVVEDVGSQALLQPAEAATGPLVQLLGQTAVDAGRITPEQRDQLLSDLADGAARGDFFLSVTMYAVLARKP